MMQEFNGDRRNYNAVDLAKFICALLVVTIHVNPFGSADNAMIVWLSGVIRNWLARIAVPFFFAASGFFLYRKTSPEDFSAKETKRYVLKLIRLYAVWTLIYSPLKMKAIIEDEHGIAYGILTYCKDILFVESYTHLWYFPALIFSVAVISFLLSRKVGLKKILVGALGLYAIGLLGQSWFGIIKPLEFKAPELWHILRAAEQLINTTRNGLFEGLLFVGMGGYAAFYGFGLSQRKALIGFAVSFFLMLIEAVSLSYFDFPRDYNMYIFLVPSTWFAFGLTVNHHIAGNSAVFKTLRILSSLIFYIHLWVRWFIKYLFNKTGFAIEKTGLLFVLTVAVSIVVSYAIYKLSDCERFKWLKKLYS